MHALGVLTIVGAALVACSGGGDEPVPCGDDPADQAECAAAAGFGVLEGVTVTGAERTESAEDQQIRFVLSGKPEAIDAALAAAGFTATFTDGVDPDVDVGGDVDVSQASNVRSASDTWMSPDGGGFARHVLRTQMQPDFTDETVFVSAESA